MAVDLLIINGRALTAQQRRKQFRACHRIGSLLLKRKSGYGQKAIVKLASKIGRQPSWLYQVRDCAAKFSKADLNQLCSHADQIRWGHVVWLLGVPTRVERCRWLQRTQRLKWTAEELRQSLRARSGKPGRSGRPLAKPSDDPATLLRQIIGRTEAWLRRYRQVWDCGAGSPLRELSSRVKGKKLRLRSELEAARNALDEWWRPPGPPWSWF